MDVSNGQTKWLNEVTKRNIRLHRPVPDENFRFLAVAGSLQQAGRKELPMGLMLSASATCPKRFNRLAAFPNILGE